MKKQYLLWVVLLVAVCMAVTVFSPAEATTSEIIASGTCGENLTWELDAAGTLTISGSGKMIDYSSQYYVPWYSQKSNTKVVIIEDGVTSISKYAFNNFTKMTSVTIAGTVTQIGESAFATCNQLVSVSIPDSVTEMGNFVFKECKALTSVTIGNGVTEIGAGSFYYCPNLSEVNLGSSVTAIGTQAFFACNKLTGIVLPDSVLSVDSSAFSSDVTNWTTYDNARYFGNNNGNPYWILMGAVDASIETYTIHPDTKAIEAIGSAVTAVTIPDSVVYIGSYAFSNCTALTDVTFGSGITEIPFAAFSGCSALTEIVIPKGIAVIGEDAFKNCTNLTSVTLPTSVTYLKEDAFYGCKNLTRLYLTDLAAWCAIEVENMYANPLQYANELYLNGEMITELVIPEGVTAIAPYAFWNLDGMISVTIANSVTSVGEYAFAECDGLLSVTLGTGLSAIDQYAFRNCTSLQDVTLLQCTPEIGFYVFSECRKLQNVYITDLADWCGMSFVSYESNPLYYADNLYVNGELITELVIPEGVTSIGDRAFSCCGGIKSVTIPASLTHIGDDAFWATGVRNVYITDLAAWCAVELESMGSNPMIKMPPYAGPQLYINGEKLENLVIPEGVTTIGHYAFYDWNDMKSITIPSTVTAIGWEAFKGCGYLNTLYVADVDAWCGITFKERYSNPMVFTGGMYVNGEKLTDLVIPEGVTSVGAYAFYCGGLSSVVIPNSVTDIGANAFYFNGLKSVTFGEGVIRIGDSAFAFCRSLESVVLPDSVTTIGDTAFNDCTALWHLLYKGTEAQWNAIEMGAYNDSMTNATRHYNCIGDEIVDLENKVCALCCQHDYVAGEIVAPTCALQGYTRYTCTLCGYGKTDNYVEPLAHSYETQITAPTCTDMGYTVYTCTACGHSYQDDYVVSLGHAYGDWEVTTEPSCEEPGSQKHTCFCGYTESEEIPATGHSYGESYWIKFNTCTEQGMKRRDCKNCDAFESDPVAAMGHDMEAVVTAPTCTERGYTTYSCTRCIYSYKDNYVDKVNHGYQSTVTAPTCTEKGYTTYTCPVCGDSYVGSYMDALGHDEVIDAAVAPTCTENGLSEGKHCARCGQILVAQTEIPATGHVDENKDFVCDVCGTVLCTEHTTEKLLGTPATCEKTGLTDGEKCANCGQILKPQKEIPALGHDWTDATCETPKTCKRCGATEGETLEHSFGEWIQVKAATVEETGLAERVCAVCGKTEQKELEKLKPAPTEPTEPSEPTQPSEPTEPTVPATQPTVPMEPATAPSTSPGMEPTPTVSGTTDITTKEPLEDDKDPAIWIPLLILFLFAAVVVAVLTMRKKNK